MNRRAWMRFAVRVRRFVMRGILHADDPPHAIALGIALGVFVALTPTVGFQMIAVVALASLLRANRAVGIPLVWISNPATFVPIYYPCYRIGCSFLQVPPISIDWWMRLATPPAGISTAVTFYWRNVMQVIAPLTLGCVVVATPISIAVYFMSYRWVHNYRRHKRERSELAS